MSRTEHDCNFEEPNCFQCQFFVFGYFCTTWYQNMKKTTFGPLFEPYSYELFCFFLFVCCNTIHDPPPRSTLLVLDASMPRSPLCSTVTMDEAKYIYREACGEHAGFTGLKKSNFLTALAGIGRTAWLRLVPSDANVVREYDSKAACE